MNSIATTTGINVYYRFILIGANDDEGYPRSDFWVSSACGSDVPAASRHGVLDIADLRTSFIDCTYIMLSATDFDPDYWIKHREGLHTVIPNMIKSLIGSDPEDRRGHEWVYSAMNYIFEIESGYPDFDDPLPWHDDSYKMVITLMDESFIDDPEDDADPCDDPIFTLFSSAKTEILNNIEDEVNDFIFIWMNPYHYFSSSDEFGWEDMDQYRRFSSHLTSDGGIYVTIPDLRANLDCCYELIFPYNHVSSCSEDLCWSQLCEEHSLQVGVTIDDEDDPDDVEVTYQAPCPPSLSSDVHPIPLLPPSEYSTSTTSMDDFVFTFSDPDKSLPHIEYSVTIENQMKYSATFLDESTVNLDNNDWTDVVADGYWSYLAADDGCPDFTEEYTWNMYLDLNSFLDEIVAPYLTSDAEIIEYLELDPSFVFTLSIDQLYDDLVIAEDGSCILDIGTGSDDSYSFNNLVFPAGHTFESEEAPFWFFYDSELAPISSPFTYKESYEISVPVARSYVTNTGSLPSCADIPWSDSEDELHFSLTLYDASTINTTNLVEITAVNKSEVPELTLATHTGSIATTSFLTPAGTTGLDFDLSTFFTSAYFTPGYEAPSYSDQIEFCIEDLSYDMGTHTFRFWYIDDSEPPVPIYNKICVTLPICCPTYELELIDAPGCVPED